MQPMNCSLTVSIKRQDVRNRSTIRARRKHGGGGQMGGTRLP